MGIMPGFMRKAAIKGIEVYDISIQYYVLSRNFWKILEKISCGSSFPQKDTVVYFIAQTDLTKRKADFSAKCIISLPCNGKLHKKAQMYTTVGGAT